jgi:hypothetical protein
MLFVHNEKSISARALVHHKQQQNLHKSSPPRRPSDSTPPYRNFIDTVLDTFHDWEGTTRNSRDAHVLNGTLPSGRMSVDFMQYETGSGVNQIYYPLGGRTSAGSVRLDSAKTLTGEVYEVAQVVRPQSVKIVDVGRQMHEVGLEWPLGRR